MGQQLELIGNPGFFAWATLAIALWGALTGTVAIFLESRKVRRDRAVIVPTPEYAITYKNEFPPEIDLFVVVRNAGLRAAFLSEMWVQVAAPTFWKRFSWHARRRGWFRVHDHRLSETCLEGGQSERFLVELPAGVPPYAIHCVEVRDQTGKCWQSGCSFFQTRVKRLLKGEMIREENLRGQVKDRAVFIQYVRVGKEEGMLIRISKGNVTQFQGPRFTKPAVARRRVEKARSLAGQFVNGEIDEVLPYLDRVSAQMRNAT